MQAVRRRPHQRQEPPSRSTCSGARAGGVILNTDKPFATSGDATKYDLYTVLLQGPGHALGVGNSPDPASVMYTDHAGKRTGLSVGDVTSIQAIYGARRHDQFDAAAANNTSATATALSYVLNDDQYKPNDPSLGAKPFAAAADITSATDVDFYKVTAPTSDNFHVDCARRTSACSPPP